MHNIRWESTDNTIYSWQNRPRRATTAVLILGYKSNVDQDREAEISEPNNCLLNVCGVSVPIPRVL